MKRKKNPEMGYIVSLIASNGGAQKAQDFFWTMTNTEFKKWEPRYRAIRNGKGSALKPPMTWWEEEFDRAMTLGTCHLPKSKRVQ
jgi:hypothetical protein